MTHYVHTGTVRDRVARQASRYDRENINGKTDLSSSEGHCHTSYCCFVKSGIIFGNFKFNLQSCIQFASNRLRR